MLAGMSEILSIPDSAVDAALDAELRALLSACFTDPVFRQRRYCHQMPQFRWLMRDAQGLIAHLAAHDLTAAHAGGGIRFAGIAEVAVRSDQRGKGLVRALLAQAHRELAARGFGWAALLGKPEVYGSSGYQATGQPVRHLRDGQPVVVVIPSFQVARLLPDAPPWPAGEIDLHGPTF